MSVIIKQSDFHRKPTNALVKCNREARYKFNRPLACAVECELGR